MTVNCEVLQLLMPILTGENHEFWSIKMKTLFKSQEVWELVLAGFVDQAGSDGEADKLKGIKKNDAKALFLIQQVVHNSIFCKNCNSNYIFGGMKYFQKGISRFSQADPGLTSPSTTSSVALAMSPILKEPLAEPTPLRRSTRDRKSNPRYADSTSCTFALLISDPIFFKDVEGEDKWCKAMGEELLAIQKNRTWDLVNFPEGKKATGIKWVFRTKYHADGSIQKHKARVQYGNYNVASTLMNINEKLCRDDGAEIANATYFRSLVGGLNYLPHTRPYIAFFVGIISRFMHNPSKLHLGAAKRILRYIAETSERGIWCSKVTNFTLNGLTDSDYAGNIDDRKSTFNFLFDLESEIISWRSKKQEVVALSTSEAEYIAPTSVPCQAVWLKRLVVDFNQKPAGATEIFCDNRSFIVMTKKPSFHSRTKHINIRYHYIQNLVSTREITLKSCDTNEQAADIFTKSLSQAKHEFFKGQLGVCIFESRESVEK
ncbi:hypothetical protein FXO37_14598 [Capsicum annuum]|nr:hypothetical protein FXO37_14598 [Capsicum annuum]